MDKIKTPESSDSPLNRIRKNISKTETFCAREGFAFKRPLLILGTFERVGSNWLLDTLNQHVHTHNEPYKQQLGETSPFSTMSSALSDVSDPASAKIDPFAQYWLETFASTKYGTADHAVKETNLFFALENFLKLFPDAQILLLKRESLGIFSSFIDQDLFTRWNYSERYDKLKKVAQTGEWAKFYFVFANPDNHDLTDIEILTRLLFLNCLILASNLQGRQFKQLAYESSVKARADVLKFLSNDVFPGTIFSDTENGDTRESADAQGTFSTRRSKTKLESFLDAEDARLISFELHRLLSQAGLTFPKSTVELCEDLLGYDRDQYDVTGRRHFDARIPEPTDKYDPATIEFIKAQDGNIEWRNTLVTNSEFCDFLNTLRSNGIHNILDGGQVFFNENMINERGGRIHLDSSKEKYTISPGYENHPVYWVTWIGAAAFAASKGLRLPFRHEIDQLINNADVSLNSINAGHKSDDVHPIHSGNYLPGEINDLVGNLAVWCQDGNDQLSLDPQSSTRYIYGTSWNRPATLSEITKDHSRPIVGNSRAVGVRLIKDQNVKSISQNQLIERLSRISELLGEKSDISLKHRDQAIIKLITN